MSSMRKRRPKTATTQRALARALHRGDATIRRWIADPRWPFGVPSKDNPVDVSEVARWAADTLDADKAAATRGLGSLAQQERQASLRLKRARAELVEVQKRIAAG